jgi:hypothetical protein
MPRIRTKIPPVEDIEWDVVQICAKRVRPNGDVEVLVQYALKWQKVDACIAEGPLYQKFLEDEAAETREGLDGERREVEKDEVSGGGQEVKESGGGQEVKESETVEEGEDEGVIAKKAKGKVQQKTRPVRSCCK